MFEGKHIHFSPLDNKPLCSYSSKLCRQRRLNGYAFCIRHILEDKSAPFKQCEFVTKNNFQKCLNAIPSNQVRGYCHSHMQVAGIIPKTERKSKSGNSASNASANSSKSSTIVLSNKKATAHDAKKESLSETKVNKSQAFKTVSINSSSKNCNARILPKYCNAKTHVSKGKTVPASTIVAPTSKSDEADETEDENAHKGNCKGYTVVTKVEERDNKPMIENDEKILDETKNSQVCFAKTNGEAETSFINDLKLESFQEKNDCSNPVYTLCVRDRWKKFKFHPQDISDSKPALRLARMQNFKMLEKLPLFVEVPTSLDTIKTSVDGDKLSSPADVVFSPPVISKMKCVNNIDITKSPYRTIANGDSAIHDYQLIKNHKFNHEEQEFDDPSYKQCESRKEFLERVRQAFNRQYQTVQKTCKLNNRIERSEKLFRSALLSCAMKDTSLCAQILSSDELKLDYSNVSAEAAYRLCNENDISESSLKVGNGNTISNSLRVSFSEENTIELHSQLGQDSRPDTKLGIKKNLGDLKVQVKRGNELKCRKDAPSRKKAKIMQDAKPEVKNGVVSKHTNSRFAKSAVLRSKTNIDKTGSNNLKTQFKKVPEQKSTKKRKPPGIDISIRTSSSDFNKVKNTQYPASLTMESFHNGVTKDIENFHDEFINLPSSVEFENVANLENVLHSVSSSDAATTPEGVLTDASFDSPFNNSTPSHPDCEFSDEDLEKSFELQIDPEIAHQASRLLEDNGLTEDDFNELFPETRVGDHKIVGRADIGDLGIDFTSNFDANDIDYSLFANIFPNFRSSQHESIPVNQQF